MCSDSFWRDLIQDSHTFRVLSNLILTMIIEHPVSYGKILIRVFLKIKKNLHSRRYQTVRKTGIFSKIWKYYDFWEVRRF